MTAAYLDTHTAIVGASGAGKTVTAKGHVEALLDAGRHVCVLDPTGAWWGLRSLAGGEAAGYDIPIFGGLRGDVQITEGQGGEVGRIIADGVSAIVDISGLRVGAEQRRFTRDLLRALRTKPDGMFHLVVDEADEFASQKPRDDYGFQAGEELIWMAKRGRLAGFVLTIITQRPASIDKEVLTQAQTLFIHQLVSPVDQKPITDYLKDNADTPTLASIRKSLASLERGERWLYSPRLKMLARGVSPMPKTFDSSRTPGPGERRVEPKLLASIDIEEIRITLAVKDAVENGTLKTEEQSGIEAQNALLRARVADLETERDALREICDRKNTRIDAYQQSQTSVEHALLRISQEARGIANFADATIEQLHSPDDTESVAAPALSPNEGGSHEEVAKPRMERHPQPEMQRRSTSAPGGLNASARKMLEMLERIAPARVTWGSLASMVGNKARGGNFNAARKAMRESSRIIEDGDYVRSSAVPARGMTRAEALDLWKDVLSNPAPRMIEALRQGFPLSRAELGTVLGIASRGGNFNNGVSQMTRNGVAIDVGGELRLADPLPGESK